MGGSAANADLHTQLGNGYYRLEGDAEASLDQIIGRLLPVAKQPISGGNVYVRKMFRELVAYTAILHRRF